MTPEHKNEHLATALTMITIIITLVVAGYVWLEISGFNGAHKSLYPDLRGTITDVRPYQTNGLFINPVHQDLTVMVGVHAYHFTVDCTYYKTGDVVTLTYDFMARKYTLAGLRCN
jgi:hypothetical protein